MAGLGSQTRLRRRGTPVVNRAVPPSQIRHQVPSSRAADNIADQKTCRVKFQNRAQLHLISGCLPLPILMLWTAPPPARQCQRCGRCLRLPRFGGATMQTNLCLLPARPTCLDVDVTAATFRSLFLAKRSAAFVLNQCPPTDRNSRADQAASGLERLGLLARWSPRVSIFRMQWLRASASPSTPAKADRHRKSKRSGRGFVTALH